MLATLQVGTQKYSDFYVFSTPLVYSIHKSSETFQNIPSSAGRVEVLSRNNLKIEYLAIVGFYVFLCVVSDVKSTKKVARVRSSESRSK